MKRHRITDVSSEMVYNCDYIPSVRTYIEVEHDTYTWAISPKGQSTGSGEAKELLDGGDYLDGKACEKAVEKVNSEIRDALIGTDVTNQRLIDSILIELDGTPDKERLGANAVVSVSAAVVKAAAKHLKLPVYRYLNNHSHTLPVPLFSIIEGAHYGFGYSSEVQEINILPVGADTLKEAIEMSRKVHFLLGDILEREYSPMIRLSTAGGGYSIPEKSVRKNLEFITDAIDKSGFSGKILLGMDCAATHFYDRDKEMFFFEGEHLTRDEMLSVWKKLAGEYPIVNLEDPFDEDDIEYFSKICQEMPDVQITGDDFFVTNPERIKNRLRYHPARALLWKYNQVGTITEALDAAAVARSNGMGIQTSERSGDNEDTLLADLTVALDAGQTKTGCLFRAEHTAKYNRFLQIEKELGADGVYAGTYFARPYMKK